MTKQSKIQKIYKGYLSSRNKNSAVNFLKFFMPEMIYRSTKLEGEHVSRRKILNIF